MATTKGASPRSAEEQILEVATSLFAQRGYYGTAMREIASGVNFQISSIYYHFPSKQELLMQIMTRTLERLRVEVESAIAPAGPSARRALSAAIRAHVRFHAEHPHEAFVADAEMRAVDAANRPALTALRDEYEAIFQRILSHGADTGEFEIADVKAISYALLAMCSGVASWFRPSGRLSIDEVADIYARLVDGCVAASPTPQPSRCAK